MIPLNLLKVLCRKRLDRNECPKDMPPTEFADDLKTVAETDADLDFSPGRTVWCEFGDRYESDNLQFQDSTKVLGWPAQYVYTVRHRINLGFRPWARNAILAIDLRTQFVCYLIPPIRISHEIIGD